VVICTRDRPEDLGRAIASVLASGFGEFELLVVDQSEGGETAAVVERFRDDGRVRRLADTARGLSRARNAGIAATTGDIVVFTDDDCEVEPEWLERIVAAMAADPTAGIAFGAVVPAPCDPAAGFIVGYEPRRRRRLRGRWSKRLDGGIGANMAVRRASLADAGGFDEMLGAGGYFPSCEDGDMTYRMLRAGWSLLHVPEARVVHHGLRDWASGSALTRRTYMAVAAAYTKHARRGDVVATFLVLQSMGMAAANFGDALLHRRRPTGWGRVIAHFTGVRRSFELKVDPERLVYVPPDEASR
jgi:glycosyltransferase involved in cell wall biosynthesis